MPNFEISPTANLNDGSSSDFSGSDVSLKKGSLDYSTVVFNLVSAVVGVGVFALPTASKLGGCFAPIFFVSIAVSMVYECSLLVSSTMIVWNRRYGTDIYINSFESFGLAASGTTGQGMATLFNMFFSLGICSAYIIQVGIAFTRVTDIPLEPQWTQMLFCPAYVFLSLLGSMKGLEKFALPAFMCAMVACFSIIFKAVFDCGRWRDWPKDSYIQEEVVSYQPSGFCELGSMGAIIFCSVCIVAQVPSQLAEMKDKSKFPMALRNSCLLVHAWYAAILILCYMAYGNFFEILTTNMAVYPASYEEAFRKGPQYWTGCKDKLWVGIACWAIIPQLVYSYPLYMISVYFAFDSFPGVKRNCPPGSGKNFFVRLVLLIYTHIVAFFGKHLSLVLTFFGAVALPFTACILPMYFSWRMRKKLGMAHPSRLRLAWHAVLISNALFAFVFGVFDAINKVST